MLRCSSALARPSQSVFGVVGVSIFSRAGSRAFVAPVLLGARRRVAFTGVAVRSFSGFGGERPEQAAASLQEQNERRQAQMWLRQARCFYYADERALAIAAWNKASSVCSFCPAVPQSPSDDLFGAQSAASHFIERMTYGAPSEARARPCAA